MSYLTDICGATVELTPTYISYRNRLIDISMIRTFQVKGKRLFINTYKQNTSVPTMCVFFDSKEKALDAFETMKNTYYGETTDAVVPKPGKDLTFGGDMILAIAPLVVTFFYLFSSHFFSNK